MCGKEKNKSPQCCLKNNVPREEWAIKKLNFVRTKKEIDNDKNKKGTSITSDY